MTRTAPRPRGLLLIAAFKFAKALLLIAGGVSALRLVSPGRAAQIQDWLEDLSLAHGHRLAAELAGRALDFLNVAGPHQLHRLALGAFLFAAVFLVEGVGLALAQRWAEYLTVVLTSSLLPLELVALLRHATATHVLTLILNIAVVAYLVMQLRRK